MRGIKSDFSPYLNFQKDLIWIDIPNNNFPTLWLYINLWAIRLGATSEKTAIIHQVEQAF